ncbi:MAG TPA: DUF6544 family protein [Nitriliruptoraceae bacterium]|nr:DUF6544 family protein [Nitriliruptoraceae bacterium]
MTTDTVAPPTQHSTGPRASRVWWRRGGILAAGVGAVAGAVWVGLHVTPDPLAPPPLEPGQVATAPLPAGLPTPVQRFYTTLYGQQVPVVDTAVISGRGTMRISGITFPARWRFSHTTGQDYRHFIELTLFGRRVTAVNEWFLDGDARLELPVGVSQGPTIDQGANLALWAEAVWMPTVWITNPAVRWEPIDDTTARLIVPFQDDEETFTVHFDPTSGLLTRMESMRFKGEADLQKTLWINDASQWDNLDGHQVPGQTAITWGDEAGPWARLTTESVIYNADLDDYLEANGP